MEWKRLIAAMALSFLALMVWTQISTRLWPAPPRPTATTGPAATQVAATQGTKPARTDWTEPAMSADSGVLAVETAEVHDEQIVIGNAERGNGYRSRLTLTTEGAAVRRAELAQYSAEVGKLDKPYQLLTEVDYGTDVRDSLATEGLTVFGPDGAKWQVGLDRRDWRYEVSTGDDEQRVRFWVDIRREGEDLLRVTKTYVVPKQSFDVAVNLAVENLSDQPLEVVLRQRGPMGIPQEDPRSDSYRKSFAGLVQPGGQEVTVQPVDRKHVQKAEGMAYRLGAVDEQVVWAGQTNKYFAALLAADQATRARIASIEATAYSPDKELGEDLSSVWTSRPLSIQPSERAELDFDLFLGPKSDEIFAQEPYRSLNYIGTVEYSWCTMQWLAEIMIALLKGLHTVTRNYGLAIILMVVIVRLLLHPVTKGAQKNMMRMQRDMKKLQPKMQAIKEKYKDNREAQNKATMELYREEGINPATQMLGCLPMLLQMPIWIALWTALNNTFELRHEPFFWFINDLAGPDQIIGFSGEFMLPLIGSLTGPIHGLNILPLLLGVSMLLQQKFQPQAAEAMADPAQAKQQKFIFYFMAVFFALILYNAPSGLNLYILTSNVIGFFENRRIRQHLEEEEKAYPGGKRPRKESFWSRWQKKLEVKAKQWEAEEKVKQAAKQEAKKAKRRK